MSSEKNEKKTWEQEAEKANVGKKEPIGKVALDLQQKALKGHSDSTDAIELQREIHKGSNSEKSYEEEVWECVDRGRKDPAISKDFFITVLFKKERHLQNIIRQYFLYRQSCPTPEYDQTVYKYHRKDDDLEYLWTVPNNVACLALVKDLEAGVIHPDHETLAHMAEAFLNRDLDKYCAKLNGEKYIP